MQHTDTGNTYTDTQTQTQTQTQMQAQMQTQAETQAQAQAQAQTQTPHTRQQQRACPAAPPRPQLGIGAFASHEWEHKKAPLLLLPWSSPPPRLQLQGASAELQRAGT